MVKSILRVSDTSMDTLLNTYLSAAKSELLGWRYSYSAETPNEVPTEYEMAQVWGVIAGIRQGGNEGESVSVENGVHRHFNHTDMVNYIRANVIPIAKVV